jgi:hypothetical protein
VLPKLSIQHATPRLSSFVALPSYTVQTSKQTPTASSIIKLLPSSSRNHVSIFRNKTAWSQDGVLRHRHCQHFLSQLLALSVTLHTLCAQYRPSGIPWGHRVFYLHVHEVKIADLQASSASTAQISALHTPCSRSQCRWHDPAHDRC